MAVVLLALVSATGCTDAGPPDDDAGTEVQESPENQESQEAFREGPAPSAVGTEDDSVAIRIDEVSREADGLQVQFTMAVPTERSIEDDDLRLVTNTGIELPRAPEQERTITARSEVTIDVAATGLTDEVREITLTAEDVSVTFPVPEGDETYRWAPAPVRQTGITDGLMRDDSSVVVVPYTVHSEGLLTEITFLALTQSSVNPDLCTARGTRPCHLVDGSGQTYPMLGPGFEFPEFGRVRGTLRFIGEIPTEEQDLQLVMEGSGGSTVASDPALTFPFTLPTAADSPPRAVAADTLPEPFDLDQTVTEDSLTVELGEISFFDDRIQIAVTAEAAGDGDDTWYLNFSGDSLIRDPSGFEHQSRGPAENRELPVEPGETIEATLVFTSRLAPETTSVDLVLALQRDREQVIPIEMPDATTTEEQ